MTDPVMVHIPLEMLKDIRDTMSICAQDLSAELDDNYPEKTRSEYPTYLRRWHNDMEPVRAAQELCSALDEEYLKFSGGKQRV